MADKTLDERTAVSFQVNPVGAKPNSSLGFSLPWAPKGVWIDPETGLFTWTPSDRQGPGTYDIPVYVVDYANGEANEMVTVKVTVKEVNERPWLLPAVVAVEPGQKVHLPILAGDRDYPANPLRYTMAGAPAGAKLTTNTGVFEWAVPLNSPQTTHKIRVSLGDNGSPNYTTNNTLTITVTTNATYYLDVAQLSEQDYEFTIDDTEVGADYLLQQTETIRDGAPWSANADFVPSWVRVLTEADYLEDSPWEEFVDRRLRSTEWTDVRRVSPDQMPYTFGHSFEDGRDHPVRFFRAVRAPKSSH